MIKNVEPAQFVNLCDAHPITIVDRHGNKKLVVPPSGKIAHVQQKFATVDQLVVDGEQIQICKRSPGSVSGLPDADFHHYYIVSAIVKMQCPEREDVLVPGEKIKDASGNIIGCLQLCI